MPTVSDRLLKQFRQHLITANVVREPRTAGAKPPMWLEPRDGTPAPGEMDGTENDNDAVIGVFRSGGVTLPWTEQRYFRKDTIDVVLRTRTAVLRDTISEAIENQILGSGAVDEYRMNWVMGDLTVIQSQLWRPLQPLGADEDGFTAVESFYFETYPS